jgi:hypothetical protein
MSEVQQPFSVLPSSLRHFGSLPLWTHKAKAFECVPIGTNGNNDEPGIVRNTHCVRFGGTKVLEQWDANVEG